VVRSGHVQSFVSPADSPRYDYWHGPPTVVNTFAPDGYFRAPIGPHYAYRGARELRSFFTKCFSAGGGIGLQHCAMTDDAVRCALECDCVRWGSHNLQPQAGAMKPHTSSPASACGWPPGLNSRRG
jgi:hypothetical protein